MPNGRIIVLNGAPRSGKSTLARMIQQRIPGSWINLGVDAAIAMTPEHLRSGIGLRPGGERPDLKPFIGRHYLAIYASIAAHAREGLDVVADFGHHESHSRPLGILPACARRLVGLDALFIGVHCPIEVIMSRRNAEPVGYAAGPGIPPPVQRWQDAVHVPGIYDLELDMGAMTPEAGADAIARRLKEPGTAFVRLAAL